MLNAGTVLGDRYQILRLIGEGGMGTVYEAEHLAVHRKVAVKVLLPEYARQEECVQRFEREAHAAGDIGHEGIVEVLDFGQHGDLPYMVMEYLVGESLADRLERQRVLPIALASRIMGQVLSALGAAHAAGIVHRDLKPENVYLITRGGMQDVAKLLDFGISKFKSEDGTISKSLTKTGALMGTPYYMAPEQALAKRDIDHRADIYSAGVMLYEMVTGRLPFLAESQAELLMAIVYQRPPAVPPRVVNPHIPEDFASLIVKAMSPDRAERFQDAGSFLEALLPFGSLTDPIVPPPGVFPVTPASVPPPGTALSWEGVPSSPSEDGGLSVSERASTGANHRRRARLGAAGGIAAVLLAGGVALTLRAHDMRPTAAPATRPPALAVPSQVPSAIVSVGLQGVPADAIVTVDGVVTAQQTLHLHRGQRYHLEVSAPGRITFDTDLVADRDMAQGISLAPVPVPSVPPPSPVAPAVVPVPSLAPVPGRHGHGHATPGPTASPPVEVQGTAPVEHPPEGHGASHGTAPGGVLTPTSEF